MQTSLPLPPEILLLIFQQLHRTWHRPARLVCKAFADAGLRCILNTVKVARCPASFERVQFIKNHPVLKYYIKGLVYAYDDITLHMPSIDSITPEQRAILDQTACDLEEFKKNGGDIDGFKDLLRSFPGLQHVYLESPFVTHGPMVAAAYFRLNPHSQDAIYHIQESSVTNLINAVGAIDTVESLYIDQAAGAFIHIDPPQYFQKLRTLYISFKENFKSLNMDAASKKTVPRLFGHSFPLLTYLHIRIAIEPLEVDDEGHLPLSFPLPSSLQRLELHHMQLPCSLRLPPQLKYLTLSNCKLMNTDLLGWVNFLAPCKMECNFYDYFTAEGSSLATGLGAWRDSRDKLLGTELSICLKGICSPHCSNELRVGLLKIIFDPSSLRFVKDVSRDIDIPEVLAEKYHRFKILNEGDSCSIA